ncbi:hypothetical protein PITC_082750 [Penicillium italicum]|uniref:Uncharacterized protein n=1 Tax=Penicillium italicum TaxID=40296 RepID=A0A0A2L6A3_PENIT|nr:hypothetical protein PITC_082750 [Penicillium italicum]
MEELVALEASLVLGAGEHWTETKLCTGQYTGQYTSHTRKF